MLRIGSSDEPSSAQKILVDSEDTGGAGGAVCKHIFVLCALCVDVDRLDPQKVAHHLLSRRAGGGARTGEAHHPSPCLLRPDGTRLGRRLSGLSFLFPTGGFAA